MPIYKHTQRATWTLALLSFVLVVDALVFFLIDLDPLILLLAVLPSFLLIAALAWLFSSMTVEVTPAELRWYFGPGFWKKSIARQDIAHARAERGKWWYGWGIRYTPRGWLYNVSGLDLVAVETRKGKTILIGTDEPRQLATALMSR